MPAFTRSPLARRWRGDDLREVAGSGSAPPGVQFPCRLDTQKQSGGANGAAARSRLLVVSVARRVVAIFVAGISGCVGRRVIVAVGGDVLALDDLAVGAVDEQEVGLLRSGGRGNV